MFKRDFRPFKQELHDLIVDWARIYARPHGMPLPAGRNLGEEIEELIKQHKISVTAKDLSSHVQKLLMANNAGRAHQLVEKGIADEGYSWPMAISIGLARYAGIVILKAIALAVYIVLVVEVWGRLSS